MPLVYRLNANSAGTNVLFQLSDANGDVAESGIITIRPGRTYPLNDCFFWGGGCVADYSRSATDC